MESHLFQPGIELVLCFTSLSDSSLSDFKGVLALLQPLATQGEHCQPGKGFLWVLWEGCAGTVSAFLLEWLLLVHHGWVIMDLWLMVPPGTFTPFLLKKENTSAVTYLAAAGPEVCVDSISGSQE